MRQKVGKGVIIVFWLVSIKISKKNTKGELGGKDSGPYAAVKENLSQNLRQHGNSLERTWDKKGIKESK